MRMGGSELPERFGALDALLRPGETDVGQLTIVQDAEVLTGAPAGAPKGESGDEGGPDTPLPRPRREGEKAARLGYEKHLFFLMIHSFQEQHRLVLWGCKRKMIRVLLFLFVV
jgi:hypothetical protein